MQRFDEQSERERSLSAAWIIEVIARKRRAPAAEDPDETSLGDVFLHVVFGQ
jgi:hypothetical protein